MALTSPGWRDHPMAAPRTDSAGYHPTDGPNGLPSAYKQYVTTFLYSFKPYLSTKQLLDHLLSVLRSINASQPPPPESPASQLERHTCFVLQAGTHRAAGWARRVAGWGAYGCRLGYLRLQEWLGEQPEDFDASANTALETLLEMLLAKGDGAADASARAVGAEGTVAAMATAAEVVSTVAERRGALLSMRAALRAAAAAPPLRPAASAPPPAASGGATAPAVTVVAAPIVAYTAAQQDGGANPNPKQDGVEVRSEQPKAILSGDADDGGRVGEPRGNSSERTPGSVPTTTPLVPTKAQALLGIGAVSLEACWDGRLVAASGAPGGSGVAAVEDAWAELVAEP